jgi:hypothetical protein
MPFRGIGEPWARGRSGQARALARRRRGDLLNHSQQSVRHGSSQQAIEENRQQPASPGCPASPGSGPGSAQQEVTHYPVSGAVWGRTGGSGFHFTGPFWSWVRPGPSGPGAHARGHTCRPRTCRGGTGEFPTAPRQDPRARLSATAAGVRPDAAPPSRPASNPQVPGINSGGHP